MWGKEEKEESEAKEGLLSQECGPKGVSVSPPGVSFSLLCVTFGIPSLCPKSFLFHYCIREENPLVM